MKHVLLTFLICLAVVVTLPIAASIVIWDGATTPAKLRRVRTLCWRARVADALVMQRHASN